MVEIAKKTGRALTVTAAILGALSIGAVPETAYAQHHGGGGGWHGGGISTGEAVGIGLGAFALGGALGAYSYPYYGYSYPYYNYSYPYYGYSYPYYGGGYVYPYGYGYGY